MSIILENEKRGKRFTVSAKAVTSALTLARADKDLDGARQTTAEPHRLAGKDGEVNEKLAWADSTPEEIFSMPTAFIPGSQSLETK